ncbi:MAG: PAS domain S-box protein, partial [Gallionella sp.]|nr:PAS domain S-box protein [Gallionella sp.]
MRVLLVEDSPDDADLILLELGKPFDVTCTRVETGAEMRAALAGDRQDIVISDFNLPRFSAHAALTVLREADADIPFIIVSACIGEESAIALMKQGASDFVMKGNLARLAPVIERELQDATARRERRQALEALHANEKLLKGITSSLGEGLYVLDADEKLIFMNPEAERLLGWSEAELLGKNVHDIIHPQKPDGTPLASADCGIIGVLRSGSVYRTDDDIFLRKDGLPIPVSYIATAISENGKASAAVTAFQDISQRKRAEQDLLESRKQLRELSAYLQTVREEERTRIARELHDELGQMLTAVKLDAMWLTSHPSGEQPGMVAKAASMSLLIDETLDAMRRVAADLRPVMLDDLGLFAAVEWLTGEFAKRTGIAVRLEMEAQQGQNTNLDECDVAAEVATAAFRIVQESLTNVARHARAEQVQVSLKCIDDRLMLRVADDGKGVAAVSGKRNSFGIIGMRERAHGLGGTLNFSSIPGKGACVV